MDEQPEPESNDSLNAARRYWDKEAAAFDDAPDHGLNDPEVRAAWRNLLQASLPPAPALILDIGCVTGSLSILLAALGHQITAMDLSPAMIARAQAKADAGGYAIAFMLGDAESPPLGQAGFDVILCRHLLWALPDPALVLQRWAALLSPPGRILFIEGFWHTGGGLHAWQTVAALPSVFTDITISDLSSSLEPWGAPVTDERYLIAAYL